MEESILKSTKKMLGIGDDDTTFDHDILTHINAAFSHLQQLGIGPEAGYTITDGDPEWEDYLPDTDTNIVSAVKVNIFLQVRLAV
jgi:FPC/CPF motif-containing protein YcgG